MKKSITVTSEGVFTVADIENALKSLPQNARVDIFYVTKETKEIGYTFTIEGSWD